MLRLGAIFIVLCMVAIAASAGAALYLVVGLRATESMIVAIAVLTGLAIYNAVSTRMRDRADLGAQIADLSRGTGDLARQVAELTRQASEYGNHGDKIIDGAAEKVRAATKPMTAELGELSSLVKQLAETVALHELKFGSTREFATLDTPLPPSPFAPPPSVAPPADKHRAMIGVVRSAIEADRIDLYLQPIVTLPQRKVRYYEAFTRLRTADGTVVSPHDFLEAAHAAGLMPKIDKTLLLRSMQVVRRLQIKNRDIGLFCNLSPVTLNDPELFPEILQFMDANRALSQAIVLEFQQSALRGMGPMETESLAALRDLGFRFCMDRVTDLRMEPRDLGERGIRYVKVPSTFLLGDASAGDIHAADLSDLLGRYGITLIAERIEAEAQVVDLLEYDVRFGQGFLFSPPRPVRAEAIRGAAESETPAAHDGNAGETRKVAAGGSGFAL